MAGLVFGNDENQKIMMQSFSNSHIYGIRETFLLANGENGSIDYEKPANEIDIMITSNFNGIYLIRTTVKPYIFFILTCILPLIKQHHYSNQACDCFFSSGRPMDRLWV